MTHSLDGDSLKIKNFQRICLYSSRTDHFMIQKTLQESCNVSKDYDTYDIAQWHMPYKCRERLLINKTPGDDKVLMTLLKCC